jgi:hypothetical protein
MRLTFLGKSTQGGGSPTLYLTDADTYVVQGWKVTGENENEIPEFLLGYLLPETGLGAPLQPTGRRWRGDDGECDTYTLIGRQVTDAQTLEQMSVPEHESCIEVGRLRKES